jgi:hypothetical protein
LLLCALWLGLQIISIFNVEDIVCNYYVKYEKVTNCPSCAPTLTLQLFL